MFTQSIKYLLIVSFLGSSLGLDQANAAEITLPSAGTIMGLSEAFTPALLQGMTINPREPFKFDFLIRPGDGATSKLGKKEEYAKLVKYFLASLTIPDKDQWVNLSPYEKNRIIEDNFGKTEMGRDLLEQDYLLKQISSSLMYPESGLGKKFWEQVYAEAWEKFHTTNIPVNTFNKVWILPDEAVVYEKKGTAYILKSHLKVMLEEDYIAKNRGQRPIFSKDDPNKNRALSPILRQIILPALEKEVNEGKNFANLRQIISGMILATWYKRSLKNSILSQVYADKAKLKGVGYSNFVIPAQAGIHSKMDPRLHGDDIEGIYQQYLTAFKKGVFNYIKEDEDKFSHQIIPRKYFAGGIVHPEVTFERNPAQLALVDTTVPMDRAIVVVTSENPIRNEDELAKVSGGLPQTAKTEVLEPLDAQFRPLLTVRKKVVAGRLAYANGQVSVKDNAMINELNKVMEPHPRPGYHRRRSLKTIIETLIERGYSFDQWFGEYQKFSGPVGESPSDLLLSFALVNVREDVLYNIRTLFLRKEHEQIAQEKRLRARYHFDLFEGPLDLDEEQKISVRQIAVEFINLLNPVVKHLELLESQPHNNSRQLRIRLIEQKIANLVKRIRNVPGQPISEMELMFKRTLSNGFLLLGGGRNTDWDLGNKITIGDLESWDQLSPEVKEARINDLKRILRFFNFLRGADNIRKVRVNDDDKGWELDPRPSLRLEELFIDAAMNAKSAMQRDWMTVTSDRVMVETMFALPRHGGRFHRTSWQLLMSMNLDFLKHLFEEQIADAVNKKDEKRMTRVIQFLQELDKATSEVLEFIDQIKGRIQGLGIKSRRVQEIKEEYTQRLGKMLKILTKIYPYFKSYNERIEDKGTDMLLTQFERTRIQIERSIAAIEGILVILDKRKSSKYKKSYDLKKVVNEFEFMATRFNAVSTLEFFKRAGLGGVQFLERLKGDKILLETTPGYVTLASQDIDLDAIPGFTGKLAGLKGILRSPNNVDTSVPCHFKYEFQAPDDEPFMVSINKSVLLMAIERIAENAIERNIDQNDIVIKFKKNGEDVIIEISNHLTKDEEEKIRNSGKLNEVEFKQGKKTRVVQEMFLLNPNRKIFNKGGIGSSFAFFATLRYGGNAHVDIVPNGQEGSKIVFTLAFKDHAMINTAMEKYAVSFWAKIIQKINGSNDESSIKVRTGIYGVIYDLKHGEITEAEAIVMILEKLGSIPVPTEQLSMDEIDAILGIAQKELKYSSTKGLYLDHPPTEEELKLGDIDFVRATTPVSDPDGTDTNDDPVLLIEPATNIAATASTPHGNGEDMDFVLTPEMLSRGLSYPEATQLYLNKRKNSQTAPKGFWKNPLTVKHIVMVILDQVIPGFREAREVLNIKEMRRLYIKKMKVYPGGQWQLFIDHGIHSIFIRGEDGKNKEDKIIYLLQLVSKEWLEPDDIDVLPILSAQKGYWDNVENARTAIRLALYSVKEFKEAYIKFQAAKTKKKRNEAIKELAIIYRREVMGYTMGNEGGQKNFYLDRGLAAMFNKVRPYFTDKRSLYLSALKLTFPELIDSEKFPEGLSEEEVITGRALEQEGIRVNGIQVTEPMIARGLNPQEASQWFLSNKARKRPILPGFLTHKEGGKITATNVLRAAFDEIPGFRDARINGNSEEMAGRYSDFMSQRRRRILLFLEELNLEVFLNNSPEYFIKGSREKAIINLIYPQMLDQAMLGQAKQELYEADQAMNSTVEKNLKSLDSIKEAREYISTLNSRALRSIVLDSENSWYVLLAMEGLRNKWKKKEWKQFLDDYKDNKNVKAIKEWQSINRDLDVTVKKLGKKWKLVQGHWGAQDPMIIRFLVILQEYLKNKDIDLKTDIERISQRLKDTFYPLSMALPTLDAWLVYAILVSGGRYSMRCEQLVDLGEQAKTASIIFAIGGSHGLQYIPSKEALLKGFIADLQEQLTRSPTSKRTRALAAAFIRGIIDDNEKIGLEALLKDLKAKFILDLENITRQSLQLFSEDTPSYIGFLGSSRRTEEVSNLAFWNLKHHKHVTLEQVLLSGDAPDADSYRSEMETINDLGKQRERRRQRYQELRALILNPAMSSQAVKTKGGIDLGVADKALSVKMDSRVRGNDSGIQFYLDPAQLAQWQNAPGVTFDIISIQPVSLEAFLGR